MDDADQAAGSDSVLGNARLILEAFELDDGSLTLTEMSRRTGISKARVRRLNKELLTSPSLKVSAACTVN